MGVVMIDEVNLVIAGVNILMNSFFQFKGLKSTSVHASFTVNKVISSHEAIALNVSITNNTNKPFSILKMFMERDGEVFDACRVIETNSRNSAFANFDYTFVTDMHSYTFDNPNNENFSLEPFDIHAYLQENQSETGWVIFNLKPESLVINKFGIKISGVEEILYANA